MQRPCRERLRRVPSPPRRECGCRGARWRCAARSSRAWRRAPAAASGWSRRCRGRPAARRGGPPGQGSGSPCGPSGRRTSWRRRYLRGVVDLGRSGALDPGVVALGLEAVGELGPAFLDEASADEDMHVVGLDVAQDARVVGDEERAGGAGLADPVDAGGDDLERVDVETGVGLVEDRELRLQQLELEHLETLLLTAGEALVDRALLEARVDREPLERAVEVLDPGAELGRLAGDSRDRGAQEVGDADAGDLNGVLHREEETGAGAFVDAHGKDVFAVERHRALGDLIARVAGDGVCERRLAGAVRSHDGVRLTLLDGEVDAFEDLAGAVTAVDADVQVLDLERCHDRLLLHGDVDVVAVDLHGIGRDRPVGRQTGGAAGAQVEPRPVQPALDGAVLDVTVGQVDVGVRADVGQREDLTPRLRDTDRYAIELHADGAVVGELRELAGDPVVACLVGSGAHAITSVRASSSSTRAISLCSRSGRPIRAMTSAKNPRTTRRRALISSMPRDMR